MWPPVPSAFLCSFSVFRHFIGSSKDSIGAPQYHISPNLSLLWPLFVTHAFLPSFRVLYSPGFSPINNNAFPFAFMWVFFFLFSLVGHSWDLCRGANPIEGLFFWQLRSGNVSGQWASETRLPVPHCGSRAGVRCRRAVSFPVRSLLPPVQVWGKKAATHHHALGMSCCWLRH